MTGTFFRSAACGLFLVATLAPARAAPDAETVAALMAAAVAATGEATLTYDSVAADGDTVTLTGVKLTATAEDGNVVAVPALIVNGVSERATGGFTATRMTFDGGTAAARGNAASWTTAAVEEVVIPSAEEIKARATVRPFKRIAFAGLNLAGVDFAAPIDAATAAVEIGDVAADAPANVLLRATGVKLPTALLTNSLVNTVVGMLRYDEFLADITMDSEYDGARDTVIIHALTLDAANVGKITIAGKASAFSLRGLTDREKSAEARANARLDSLTVRIDNAGFVERMLDMQAELLGGTRDDVRAQLVLGALPFALSFVKEEAFRDQFLAAMTAFLENPQSLTVTFAPSTPVPLGKAMRTAARSPADLPGLLAPTVQANN